MDIYPNHEKLGNTTAEGKATPGNGQQKFLCSEPESKHF